MAFNKFFDKIQWFFLTLSRRKSLSYRNQSIDLKRKSMEWFLYGKNLCHERVKEHQKAGAAKNILSRIFERLNSCKQARLIQLMCSSRKLNMSIKTITDSVRIRHVILLSWHKISYISSTKNFMFVAFRQILEIKTFETLVKRYYTCDCDYFRCQ